jgi:hypothetical protein
MGNNPAVCFAFMAFYEFMAYAHYGEILFWLCGQGAINKHEIYCYNIGLVYIGHSNSK